MKRVVAEGVVPVSRPARSPVIHATAEDITVEPVIDFAQIALASIATALFLIVWIARLARGAGDGETSPSVVGQIKRVIG